MTEAEWQACSEPGAMLDFLRIAPSRPGVSRPGERKLRLALCACCRRVRSSLGTEGRAPHAAAAVQAARSPPGPLAPLPPGWRACEGGTVPRSAARLYAEGDFAALPVLADALEEAGCADADLLGHLRGPGPHVRGCWALDRLLNPD